MKVGRWTISTNRVDVILEPSVKKADAFISNFDRFVQELCFQKIENTTFSYYDTWQGYGNHREPPHTTEILVSDVGREFTDQISNKFWLANAVKEKNLESYVPKTYTCLTDAIESIKEEKVLYIKSPHDSMGRGVRCIKTSDLSNIDVLQNHIIQESVSDILLYNGRKMDFRFYVLAHNKELYINRLGYAIVHAGNYDPNSTSHDIQVGHDVKSSLGELNSRVPFTDFTYYDQIHDNLKFLISGVSSLFDTVLAQTSLTKYSLFGVDAIPCSDKTMKLLEINSWPWLQRDAVIESVTAPMFASLMTKTVLNMNNGHWVKIK